MESSERAGSESTHNGCGGRNQGFWHFNVPICIDAPGQLIWEEFWEGVVTTEECTPENVIDQVLSVNEISVRRDILLRVSHLS